MSVNSQKQRDLSTAIWKLLSDANRNGRPIEELHAIINTIATVFAGGQSLIVGKDTKNLAAQIANLLIAAEKDGLTIPEIRCIVTTTAVGLELEFYDILTP